MLQIFNYLKELWKTINKIHPETKTLIIVLLFGWVFYLQIKDEIKVQLHENEYKIAQDSKNAEKYSMESALEINQQVKLISKIDNEAFDVLLLNYHNNTQSLQGYKYLYLSCLTEAPKSLDTEPLKPQWNKIDYIYFADELSKIHEQSFVKFDDVESMATHLPKFYRLVKPSEAKSVAVFTIEGHDYPIGLIILLYKEKVKYEQNYTKNILPCIQRLAILLDYERVKQ